MKFLQELKRRYLQFIRGRYGHDDLNTFLMTVYTIWIILTIFFLRNPLGWGVAVVLGGLILYRSYSRNLFQRSKENLSFLDFRKKVMKRFKRPPQTHRIFNCPNCNQKVRVPKGRGKIELTCPNGEHKFTKG